MSVICLTSSAYKVMDRITRHLPKPANQLKLGYIDTAAEVSTGSRSWLAADREALVNAGFLLTDFTLTGKSLEEVRAFLGKVDGVFVSGGNTFYLLQQMKKSGFDQLIGAALKAQFIYIGSSAGSVVAGPSIEVIKCLDSQIASPELTTFEGLGLVNVVVLPHWGSEAFKKEYQAAFETIYATNEKLVPLREEQFILGDGKNCTIMQLA